MEQSPSGFILIKKPIVATSFWCVKRVRRVLPKKTKIGHAGTLDPYATGLLIIAIGRQATRRLDELRYLPKEYVVRGKLGEATLSLDIETDVIETCEYKSVTRDVLQHSVASFGTAYMQIPPIYSALKHEGLPLYKWARQKWMTREQLLDVAKQKAKEVALFQMELLSFETPFFDVRAHVSAGTYIRSLVRDIAQRAQSCATMVALERSAIGPFRFQDAIDASDINQLEDVMAHLMSVDEFFKKIKIESQ